MDRIYWERKIHGVDRLNDPDPLVRREVALKLYTLIRDGALIYKDEDLDSLKDSDPIIRMLMADLLCERALHMESMDGALPALAKALGDEKAFVRKSVSNAINASVQNPACEFRLVVDVLIKALEDENVIVKKNAACSFMSYRYCHGEHDAVVDALKKALQDEDIRYYAVFSLARISEMYKKIDAKVIIDFILDEDKQVALTAMQGMGQMDAVDLIEVRGKMAEAVKRKPEVKRKATEAYVEICNRLSKKRQKIDMPGEVLKARVKPPKKTFRQMRVAAV